MTIEKDEIRFATSHPAQKKINSIGKNHQK